MISLGSRRASVRGLLRTHRRQTSTSSPPSPSPSPSSTSAPPQPALEQSSSFVSVVPNTGSTARDHLANERTFLAWARTGLTFVGLGVAIDSLLRVSAGDQPKRVRSEKAVPDVMGVTKDAQRSDDSDFQGSILDDKWKIHVPATALVLTGGSVLTYSTFRYFRVQRCLQQGTFPLNRIGMGAVVISTSLLTLASLIMTISDEDLDTKQWHPVNIIRRRAG